jgi:hypothetical protein
MRRLLPVLCVLSLAACGDREVRRAGPLPAEAWVVDAADVPAPGSHVRHVEPTSTRYGGLDVAVTSYAPREGSGPEVLLVGVVHIADQVYYEALQAVLDACPVVLFEAVKPRDSDVRSWWESAQREDRFATALQARIAKWLGMRYQLDAIDYSHPRFVHADMDAETFAAAGGLELLPGVGEGGVAPDAERILEQVQNLGDIVFARDSPFQSMARAAFSKVLGTADLVAEIEMHPMLGDLILTRRNAVVLEALARYLTDPEAEGPIAVFYGSAHMTGIEQALIRDHGYARSGGRWYRAWALRRTLAGGP